MTLNENPKLPYLSQDERLKIYQFITSGCTHLWSKNKAQEEKILPVLENLHSLAIQDPYFLAHLTAWALKQDSKDLQVATVYVNSLSGADGQSFSPKSKYKKPNLRYVSHVLLQDLDPKLASRVYKLASLKWGIKDVLRTGTHCPTSLMTAFKKYLKYRENNLNIVQGIAKAGLSRVYRNLYRMTHTNPSDEVASILRWQQKDRKIEFAELEINFEGKTDLEIAEEIRKEKIKYFGVVEGLSKVKKKMSPVIAVAVLEQCTGNQAVILRSMFEEQGVLEDPEVLKLYKKKIREAKTALDRAEMVSKDASEVIKGVLAEARSEARKKALEGLGKVFLHLDASGSMSGYFDEATKLATILAECVDNPKENFKWGLFGNVGEELSLPDNFIQDAFKQVLFGRQADAGATNVFALYPTAREFGAEYDVIVTDQGHNTSDLNVVIKKYHEKNLDIAKPKACLIIDVANYEDTVKKAYEENGIPVAVVTSGTLTQSALVVQTIRKAIEGPKVVLDEIMNTELPKYPDWWFTV